MIHLTPHPITQSEAARSLSSRSGTAQPLPPRTEGSEVAPADDAVRSSAPRLRNRITLLVGFWLALIAAGIRMGNVGYVVGVVAGAIFGTFLIRSDRFARWCRSWSGDVVLTSHAVCPDCERACALVNPDVPTSLPCQGRREVADCLICIRKVEFARGEGCPSAHGRRHLLANKRDKPRLTLVKGDPETDPA